MKLSRFARTKSERTHFISARVSKKNFDFFRSNKLDMNVIIDYIRDITKQNAKRSQDAP